MLADRRCALGEEQIEDITGDVVGDSISHTFSCTASFWLQFFMVFLMAGLRHLALVILVLDASLVVAWRQATLYPTTSAAP